MVEYLKEFMVIYIIFIMGAISPGPDFINVVRNSTGYGSRVGFKTALGISVGSFITLSYIFVGIGAIFNQFPILKEIVKYVGALYLFYLGIKSLRYRYENE
jgi:threonine/homoserine/homoserine lactone efflux protein|tara:strand:+ start:5211 stop:5513 length:303 start_codon:yes stop_codon:yes gene_type:complete